jgi:hypothetical protein
LLAAVFEHAPSGIFLAEMSGSQPGRVVRVNPADVQHHRLPGGAAVGDAAD